MLYKILILLYLILGISWLSSCSGDEKNSSDADTDTDSDSDSDTDTDTDTDSDTDADTDSDSDSDADTDTDTDSELVPGTWMDNTTGLVWQNPAYYNSESGGTGTIAFAVDYCEKLELDGYSDWRLPNISELRTLIKDCETTVRESTCPIADPDCLNYGCLEDYLDDCFHCEINAGPGKDGCYWTTEFTDTCKLYVSASQVGDNSSQTWTVNFSSGAISTNPTNSAYRFRCVRGEMQFGILISTPNRAYVCSLTRDKNGVASVERRSVWPGTEYLPVACYS